MKKMNRVISLLLAVVMVLGMFPASVFAAEETTALPEGTVQVETPEAAEPAAEELTPSAEGAVVALTVDGVTTEYDNYADAQTALSNAYEAGGTYETVTMKLLQDVTMSDDCLYSCTLDLNGCTLTAPDGEYIRMSSSDQIVIEDTSEAQTGTVTGNATGLKPVFEITGTVTIKGGTFNQQNGTYAIKNYGTLTIEGGSFSKEVINERGTLNITGGTFTVGVRNSHEESILNITGGSFYNVSLLKGSATIDGGTFRNGYSDIDVSDGATLNLTGGTFPDGIQMKYASEELNPEDYLAPGYFFMDGSSNIITGDALATTTVTVKGPYAAAVTTADGTTTYYATVEAAAAYAVTQSGSTLKLLTDCTVEGNYGLSGAERLSGDFILDLNGKTLTGGKSCPRSLYVTGSLTIRDSSAAQTGTIAGAPVVLYGTALTIEGGNFRANINTAKGTLTIKGGTFYGTNREGTTVNAVRMEGDAVVNILGGTFDCAVDVRFYNFTTGTLAISGGTFTGGLQLVGQDDDDIPPAINTVLAEGAFLLSESGKKVTVADDATSTGTETVIVGSASTLEAELTVGEDVTYFEDIDDALAAANTAVAEGTYTHEQIILKVLKDAAFGEESRSYGTVRLNGLTLDLNGCMLRPCESGGIYFETELDYTTNIRDSSANGTGKILLMSNHYAVNGTVNLYGGTVGFEYITSSAAFTVSGTALNIYGGTINSDKDFYGFSDRIRLYGGTFEGGIKEKNGTNPEDYLASGYVFVDESGKVVTGDALATTTVTVKGPYEASVTTTDGTTTYYATVEAAAAYAVTRSGSTLKLLADCAVDDYYGLKADKSQPITLDLNGYTLKGKQSYGIYWMNGTLTITDSSEAGTGTISHIVKAASLATVQIRGGNFPNGAEVSGSSTLEIYGGNFTGDKAVYLAYDNANLTIYGGTFQGSEADIVISAYMEGYTGTIALYGGTFPGGLQIDKSKQHKGAVPTANQILAEGYAYFTEAGALVTMADDALTTGTETVTVGLLADCEAELTVGETTTRYLDIDKALAAANTAVAAGGTVDTVTLKVLKDAAFSEESLDDVYLVRLNGFTLDLNGCALGIITKSGGHTRFSTESGYTTKITDTSAEGKGRLTPPGWYSVRPNATVSIYGGGVESGSGKAMNILGTMNIYGGTVTGFMEVSDGVLNIYGGTFTGEDDFSQNSNYTITLYGGTFKGGVTGVSSSIDVTAYLAEGYVFLDESGKVVTGDALKTTTVTVINPAASVTTTGGATTYYATVEAAAAYADTQTGSTLKLLADCTVEGRYGISGTGALTGSFILDLNGKTLSGTNTYTIHLSGGALTIRDSSEAQTGTVQGNSVVMVRSVSTMTIEGGNFRANLGIADGTLTIKGGTFYGTNREDGDAYAVRMEQKAVVNILGGTFDCAEDVRFNKFTTGTLTISGGTFIGGLQLVGQGDDDVPPTVIQALAEGYACFNEAGALVTVADDAITTGTETVTVGKLSDCEAQLTVGETTTRYLDIDKALAAANTAVAAGGTADTVTLKVLKDATLENTYLNGFTLELNGCTLTTADNQNYVVLKGYTTVVTDSSEAQTGYLKSSNTSTAINIFGTLTVKGGKVGTGGSTDIMVVYSDATLNIQGGYFPGWIAAYNKATVNITGGNFLLQFGAKLSVNTSATISVSGGTFTGGIEEENGANVESFLADGYVFLDESGNLVTGDALKTTTVTVKGTYAATVTTTGGTTTLYTDLPSAVAYAVTQTDSTVKMLMDVDLGETCLKITGGTFTLDLNGKTLRNNYRPTSATIYLTFGGGTKLTIRDSSATESTPGTGKIINTGSGPVLGGGSRSESFIIYGGTFQAVGNVVSAGPSETIYDGNFISAEGSALVVNTGKVEIYGGTFSGVYAVNGSMSTTASEGYYIYGGTFQGTEADLSVGYTSNWPNASSLRNFTLYGGTFPGGLTIAGWDDEPVPTLAAQLGDGCAYFNEADVAVIPAADALTTGTETVTVKKQVALNIALDKEVYLMDDEYAVVTFTVGQKELTGNLYVHLNGKGAGVTTLYSNDPLVTGKTMHVAYFRVDGAGEHTIAISFVPFDETIAKGTSNTVTFTVKKVPNENLSKHLTAAQSSFTYDGTAKSLDLISNYTEGSSILYLAPESYTLSYWQGDTQVENPIDVGTYTVKITMAETNYYEAADNYEIGTLTIQQDDLTAEMLDYIIPETGAYRGFAFKATAAMKSHITGYGELKLEYLAEGQTERTTEHPVEPGTYTVYVSATGGDNVKASEVSLGSFTIEKGDALMGYTLLRNGERWNGQGGYIATYDDKTEVTMRIKPANGSASTAAIPSGTVEFQVRKVDEAGKYGEVFTVVSGTLDETGEVTVEFQLEPGTYAILINYLGDEYYEGTRRADGTDFKITSAAVTLTPSDLEQIYDGEVKTISFTNSTQKLTSADFTVTYYQVNENMGTISKVNRAVSIGRYLYVVELKQEHQSNYHFANPITIDGDTLPDGTYDNAGFMDIVVGLPEAQEPIYFTEGAVTVYLVDGTYSGNTLINPNGTVATYSSSNSDVAEVAADGTVTLKRTGTVTIFATSEKDGTTPVRASYTLTIEKKDATVTVTGLTATYGEAFTLKAEDLTITGCTLEDLDLSGLTFTGYTVGQSVGTYYITPAGITSETYDLVFAAGDLTVQPKAIDTATITVTAENKIYDGTTEASLTATLPEGTILAGDKVTVSAEGAFAAATAGTEVINVTGLTLEGKDAENYVLTGTASATAAALIEKATVVFTTESKTFTYDGTEKALEIEAETNNGLKADYTVSYSGTPVAVGTYTVSVTLADTVNYTADTTGLEGKTLTITAAKQQSFTIGGLEDALTYGDFTTLTAEDAEGTVTFKITSGDAAKIEGNVLTAIGVGKVMVTATSVKEGYEDKIISASVTIGKRVLTASATASDRTYNGKTEVEITIKLDNVAFDDTVTATALGTMATADAGTGKLVYVSGIVLSDAAHYVLDNTSLQTSVNINPIVIDEFTATAENKIYDGTTEATVTVLGSADILEGDDVTILATGLFDDANAGEKTVTVTATGLTGSKAVNYKLSENLTATAAATISPATVLFEIGSASFFYDGKAKTVEITAEALGKSFADFTVSYDPAEAINVGTYTVTVTLNDAVNFVGAPAPFQMTILPADQKTLLISGMPGILDYGKVFQLTTNAAEGATVTWKSSDNTIATVENGKVTILDVDREVTITATATLANHTDAVATVTFTPVAKAVTFQLTGLNTVYNGSVQGITVTPSVAMKDFTITYTDEQGNQVQPVNAGIYHVEVKTTGNHYTGSTTGTFTIAKAKLEATLSMEGWTYGEKAKTPSWSVSTRGADVTITYSGLGLKDGQPYGAGSYTVTALFEDSNYEPLTLTADFEIAKATLIATAEDATRVYGESNPALTVTVSGFVNGDDLSDLIVIPSASTTAVASSPVGTYEILVTGGRAENYEFTYVSGTLTVVPATGSFYIVGASRTALVGETMNLYAYLGNARPAVTWKSSDETVATVDENGLVITHTAGEVTITATLADSNYQAEPATFTITVEKKTLNLMPQNTILTYNGQVQSVAFQPVGDFVPVVGENVWVSYTLNTDASVTTARNAGTYVVVYEIVDTRYQGVGTFTLYINKATVALKPLDVEMTYGETIPAFSIDPDCLLGTDKTDSDYIAKVNAMFEFLCEADETSHEGLYEILLVLAEGHSLTEDANYDFVIDANPGQLTITNINGGADCPTAHFTDLDPDAWYHNALDFVVGRGLMNGVSDTLFQPNGSTTRGMIVTILWRLEGQPAEGENIFSDVKTGAYYEQAVAWAAANGIVKGYGEGIFAPDQDITREEAAAIFYRYAQYKGSDTEARADLSIFTDGQTVAAWAEEAVAWAVAEGLINGRTDGSLDPRGTAKRVEVAAILMRLVENVLS